MRLIERERVAALLAEQWTDEATLEDLLEFFAEEKEKYLLSMTEEQFIAVLEENGITLPENSNG